MDTDLSNFELMQANWDGVDLLIIEIIKLLINIPLLIYITKISAFQLCPGCHQGDRIGQFLANWVLLFWKDDVAQRNGDIYGYVLLKQIYYIST
jgi:hypothetical protein